MAAFLVRRFLSGVLLVALLTFLTFVVFNTIPTNPACLVVACGPHTTTNDAQIREADHRLGIDRSVFVQYGHFVWRLVRHADLGTAWTSNAKVGPAIGQALPVTASLVGGGMVLMLLLALPLGCLAATRPRTATDRGLLGLSLIGLAIHPFVLGITLRDLFARRLGVNDLGYCPLSGTTPRAACGGVRDWATHLAVPWLVFALFFLPLYMRMLRVRLLETLSEPWISTARAKGASERRVVVGHALRNAIGPILPLLAIDAGTAITAAIYLETVFGLPGIGLLAVQAFSGQQGGYDLPLTAGIVTTIGAFVVLLNIAADLAAAWLDPRTRTRTTGALIQLPHAVASRPRLRKTITIAFAAAAAAILLLAVTHHDKQRPPGITLGLPVRIYTMNWNDSYRVTTDAPPIRHGFIQTHVTEIEIGAKGWRVHATITNATPLPLPISQRPGGVYPLEGMSLLVPTANGFGGNELKAYSAEAFLPAVPESEPAAGNWHGTFAGTATIPPHAQVYVGFGTFTWNARLISTSTQNSIETR
jgi:peptide/nickel transport system permease protein